MEIRLYLCLLVGFLGIGKINITNAQDTVFASSEYYHKLSSKFQYSKPQLALSYVDSMLVKAEAKQDSVQIFYALKLKADVLCTLGDNIEAVKLYKQALDLAEILGDFTLLVKIYNNIGGIFYNNGKYDLALKYYLQTYKTGQSFFDKSQKAVVLGNIGMIHRQLDLYDEADAYYRKAVKLYQSVKDNHGLAQLYNNLGILKLELKQHDSAFVYLNLAQTNYENVNSLVGIANVLNNIAYVYLDLNQPDNALDYAKKAFKIREKLSSKRGLLNSNFAYGLIYCAKGDIAKSIRYFKVAEAYADSTGNLDKKMEVYYKLAEAYREGGMHKDAANYFQRHADLLKETLSDKVMSDIALTQADFDLTQKETQIDSLTQEAELASNRLRSRSLTLSILALLTIITVISAVFFIYKFRATKKLNTILSVRNSQIERQKLEIEKQKVLIEEKNNALELAHKENEQYNEELKTINDRLEEKIKARTKELDDTYKKLLFHINNTPLAVLEWDHETRLVRWPKQAQEIFGWRAEEILGVRIDEEPFVAQEDKEEIQQVIKQLCRGELQRQYYTKIHIAKSGKTVLIEWSHSVILDEEGKLESILTIANDVTQRERVYHDLKATNKELDTFLYKASHDLRGPIARMQGIINLGVLECKDEVGLQYFGMLNKVSTELNSILLRLLMIHNIQQHAFEVEEVNLRDEVNEVITENRLQMIHSPIKIENHIPFGLNLTTDRVLLKIILFNLLENATNFACTEQPLVRIEAGANSKGEVVIRVVDNGVGIPYNLRHRIFDIFFQGSSRSTGTGLGLYMVRKAARKLGGQVDLIKSSELTTFEVVLPSLTDYLLV